MIDFKQIIAEKISKEVEMKDTEILQYIEIPPNTDMGDYAFQCFKLAQIIS